MKSILQTARRSAERTGDRLRRRRRLQQHARAQEVSEDYGIVVGPKRFGGRLRYSQVARALGPTDYRTLCDRTRARLLVRERQAGAVARLRARRQDGWVPRGKLDYGISVQARSPSTTAARA